MRTPALFLVGGVSVAVVAIVVVLLWTLGGASGERDRFSSLEIAPRDAVFYMALNTDPSSPQWIAFDDVLQTLNAQQPLRTRLDEVLEEVGLEWERDILALAGDEGYIAITSVDALEADGGVLAGFQLRNQGRAEEVFQQVRQQAEDDGDDPLLEEEYEGVTIYYSENDLGDLSYGEDDDSGALAFAEGVMIFGITPQEVKLGLDVVQGRAPNAEGNDRLRDLRDREGEEFIAWGYADMAQLWDFVQEEIEASDEDSPFGSDFDSGAFVDVLRDEMDRLSFSLRARGDGFVFDTLAVHGPDYDSSKLAFLEKDFESELAAKVPENTMFFSAGYDIYGSYLSGDKSLWDEPIGPDGETINDSINEFEAEIGIDLEDDLLRYMTGEYAVAVNVIGFAEEPDVRVLGLIGVSDADAVRESVEIVSDYLVGEDVIFNDETSEGLNTWVLTEEPGEAAAWTVNGDEFAAGYPVSAVEDFLSGDGESLADSDDWQDSMDLLPGKKGADLYLSLARIIEELRAVEGAEADFEESTEGDLTFDDLAAIRSFAVSSSLTDDGFSSRTVVLIR